MTWLDDWLKEKGYDGLSGEVCGCRVGNLMPCEEGFSPEVCKPGYARYKDGEYIGIFAEKESTTGSKKTGWETLALKQPLFFTWKTLWRVALFKLGLRKQQVIWIVFRTKFHNMPEGATVVATLEEGE